MGSVGLVFRAELRRRWATWLMLSLLVAVIGGTVLSGFSADRRTNAAFPSYVKRYGFNAEVFDVQGNLKNFSHTKYVKFAASGIGYFNGKDVLADGQFVPGNYLTLYGLPTSHLDDTVKLLSGRWPTGPHDILVGFSMQQQYHLHLGSVVEVPFYLLDQRNAVLQDDVLPRARGPRVKFRVVGVEASLVDFPSASPTFTIYTSKAFDRSQGRRVVTVGYAQVRLLRGAADMPQFQPLVNNLNGGGTYFVQDEDAATASIEASIHPQAVGWLLFGLFALLAGVALVAQALSRQSLVERESYPTLVALGMRPQQLFELGLLRSGAIGLVGAVGSVSLAFAFSPFTPVGEAGAAAPAQGFVFDSFVYWWGAAAIVLGVALLAVVPSWRSSQVGATMVRLQRDPTYRSSAVATSFGRLGAPPSVLIGVRNALERGRGRSRVPVVTALIGTALAVAALAGTSVFGSSLSNLVSTPRLYGSNWQVDLQDVPTNLLASALTSLKANPEVTRVTYGGQGKFVNINGAPVQSVYVRVAKGPMVFSLIVGHHPGNAREIDIGSTSMAAAHAHVGGQARISVVNLAGKTHTTKFTVVGSVAIPPDFDLGGPGDGDVILLSGLESLACASTAPTNPCIQAIEHKLATGNSWNIQIGVASGAAGRAAIRQLDEKYASYLVVETTPTNLVNFGEAVDFPLLLGGTLALFGAAMLSHLLFVSVARRRRQFAMLKVLGMYRRQVASTLSWQSATVALVGVVLGVPLGVAVGRVVWRAFATKLGVVPVDVVSVSVLSLLVVGIVVSALVLSFIPALLATRVRPADALREPT